MWKQYRAKLRTTTLPWWLLSLHSCLSRQDMAFVGLSHASKEQPYKLTISCLGPSTQLTSHSKHSSSSGPGKSSMICTESFQRSVFSLASPCFSFWRPTWDTSTLKTKSWTIFAKRNLRKSVNQRLWHNQSVCASNKRSTQIRVEACLPTTTLTIANKETTSSSTVLYHWANAAAFLSVPVTFLHPMAIRRRI